MAHCETSSGQDVAPFSDTLGTLRFRSPNGLFPIFGSFGQLGSAATALNKTEAKHNP